VKEYDKEKTQDMEKAPDRAPDRADAGESPFAREVSMGAQGGANEPGFAGRSDFTSRSVNPGDGQDATGAVAFGDKAMAGVFCVLIIVFAAAGLILPDRRYSPRENRYLAQAPVLSWQSIQKAEYMKAAEAYITDQFPGRDYWVSFKALCQRLSGQSENNGVYFAAENYLIGKPQKAAADIADRNIAAVLALQSSGYDTALLICPMAAEILQDKLPHWAYSPEQAALMAKLRREAPDIFVDIESALRQASAEGDQVFFRTDHHWTATGAYTAYRTYMIWRGEEPFSKEAFEETLVSEDFYGTLWSKNSLPGLPPDRISAYAQEETQDVAVYEVEYFDGANTWTEPSLYQPAYLEGKDKYAYFLGQNQPLAVIRRLNPAKKDAAVSGAEKERQKLLIFKDSYAHCFAPFLAPHFDEIHLADLRYWRQNPIAYMEEQGIRHVLFLYDADSFSSDRSISQIGAYLR